MRVELFGNTSLLSSISVELNEVGIDITLNKANRSSSFHYRGGSVNSTSVEQSNCFVIFETEFEDECEIVLFPESAEERLIMNGLIYYLEDRGQVSLQCIPREKLKSIKSLYNLDARSIKNRLQL